MKTCLECGDQYDDQFRNTNSKYCGERCRKIVRSRVQKNQRQKRKDRAAVDLEFASEETFKKYKIDSPKRELEFALTSQDFKDHIEKPCYYCNSDYKGIGFDRVDNDKGYIISNVVPCCSTCNRMKRAQTKNDFIEQCVKVAETMGYLK